MLRHIPGKIFYLLRQEYLLAKLKLFKHPLICDLRWINLEVDDPNDDQMIRYVLNAGPWHTGDLNTLRTYVNTGDTAIDVGANMGFVTIELAQLVGQKGRVLAIEPCRKTFRQLLRTIQLNGSLPVDPLNLACGSVTGKAKIYSLGRSSGLNTLHTPPNGESLSPEVVAVETLDSIVARLGCHRVDFIKIDTEGWEAEVLKGARKTIDICRPKLWFEISTEYLSQSREAIDFLLSAGYRITGPEPNFSKEGSPITAFGSPKRSLIRVMKSLP